VFVAVCERMGIETGVDLFKLMDVAEDLIVPMMDHMVRVDRESLTLGFAGVYSTFLLHAKRARSVRRAGADILVWAARR
jgi:4-hydroxy-2-oxovalerate/4-hydroxy-2-oxohexanoate aldolase